MGGYLGFAPAAHFPDRLLSLIVGGSSPYNRADKTEPGPMLKVARQGLDQGADAAIQATRELAGNIRPKYEERLRTLDFRAMVAPLEAYQFHKLGLEGHLAHMDIPCFVY